MSFGSLRNVKAAKVVQSCVWCWTRCEVGQPRVGFFGQWDGEMQDWHMHPDCYDAFQREDRASTGGDGSIHDEKHTRGMTCGEMMDCKATNTSSESRKS
jgi:hypothetical protein